MIIWSGHGILIPVFALLGAFGGSAAMNAVMASAGFPGVSTVLGALWGAAAAVLLYAMTFGKTVQESLYDPAIKRTVQIKKRHTFFFVSAFTWAMLMVLIAGLASFAIFKGSGLLEDGGGGGNTREESAFDAANSLINSARKGIAHGNTPEAEKLAAQFSRELKRLRDEAIEDAEKNRVSLTDEKFLTFCQISEHGCAFIVHVPAYRKFTDEAKEFIASAAWMTARKYAGRVTPAPEKLAVGLRGVLLYGSVWVGTVAGPEEDPMAGIEARHSGTGDRKALQPFFEVAPSKNSTPKRNPNRPAGAAGPEQPALPTPLRDWKSADGRILKASLIRFVDDSGENAEFKREDGEVFTIPIEKFAPESRSDLRALFEPINAGDSDEDSP